MDKLYSIPLKTEFGIYEILGNSSKILRISRVSSLIASDSLLETEKNLKMSYFPTHLTQCYRELESYFRGDLRKFTVVSDFFFEGTAFQVQVWQMMAEIPYGHTISYSELAKLAGNPRACRSIGNICNKNPFGVIIPCHRVVAKHGIGGFRNGIEMKELLLEFERKNAGNSNFLTNL